MQVQGQHSHQWTPFQVAGLQHAWKISHQISRYIVYLSGGSVAESFHSLRSLSVSCFHVILGLPGPLFPSTCMSKAVLTAPLERSTPYQRSFLSFRMRSRSSMSSRASSSLDLVLTMSCSLTLQICLIIALSFRCRCWRFGFFIYENVQYFLSEYHCLLLSWMHVRREIRSWVQSLAGPATFFYGD